MLLSRPGCRRHGGGAGVGAMRVDNGHQVVVLVEDCAAGDFRYSPNSVNSSRTAADLVVVVGTQAHVDPVGGTPSKSGTPTNHPYAASKASNERVTDLHARLTGSPQSR
ncbi:hypothetical protein [Mycolicibacterium llatzerense]|uniref:Uncharacterized protein n=1 Tax=Mycolicibacterium llatzerense TaxID=280871 RepID=A0A0D1LHH8_9MYCO|nr:hypothetical protein [Mycolicibacterium llatzerense]KIU15486.1 hypothetical protein TL10_18350 [Mycolicibacterium llatzerense]